MCGACGTGTVRPPWEVLLAGDRPADRRRRAAAAAQAADGRVKVTPWGSAGYLLAPTTGPIRTCPDLDALALGLLPHLRLPMPACSPCHHPGDQHLVNLPTGTDRQRLAVWSALAAAHRHAGPLTIEIHTCRPGPPSSTPTSAVVPDHHRVRVSRTGAARPNMLLRGPHAAQYGNHLLNYLDGSPSKTAPNPNAPSESGVSGSGWG